MHSLSHIYLRKSNEYNLSSVGAIFCACQLTQFTFFEHEQFWLISAFVNWFSIFFFPSTFPGIYLACINSSVQYSTHIILVRLSPVSTILTLCNIIIVAFQYRQRGYINFWTFHIAKFRVPKHCFSSVFSGTLFIINISYFVSGNYIVIYQR